MEQGSEEIVVGVGMTDLSVEEMTEEMKEEIVGAEVAVGEEEVVEVAVEEVGEAAVEEEVEEIIEAVTEVVIEAMTEEAAEVALEEVIEGGQRGEEVHREEEGARRGEEVSEIKPSQSTRAEGDNFDLLIFIAVLS